MDAVAPTVTLHLLGSQAAQALAYLTAWCVQEGGAFFQTCHHAALTEVEILNPQHQLLVRFMLYVLPPDAAAAEASAAVATLPVDSSPVVQHLVQLCLSA